MLRRIAASVVLLDGWRRALLALFAGAVTTLGLAPFNLPLAAFVGFPLLVLMLDGAAATPGHGALRRLGPAFRIGWLFGFGYFAAGLWWLGAAMLVDAEGFLWALPLAVLVLPAVLALYMALAAALARAFWSEGTGRILALAGSVALFEVLRGLLFTGFPWNAFGVIAAPVPLLMQSASVVGLHGLTLLGVFVFAAPALLLDARPRRAGLALALGLCVLHAGFGAWRLASADTGVVPGVELRVVQPDILQSRKWDAAEADRIFERLVSLTAERPARAGGAPTRRLVVWPESAVPFLLTERPDALARIAEVLEPGEMLVAGAARMEPAEAGAEPRYYNSVYLIDDAGEILDAADKVHLVPFGEYLPFQAVLESVGVSQLARLPGGFSAGARRRVLQRPGWPDILPLVCYEIIFQDEVGDAAKMGAQLIVNVTNDAWYGQTPGPYQHLRQAELTAVAFGLPLLRSANTGISIVNDAYGKTSEALSLGSSGVISAALPVAMPQTLFASYGNAIFWCLFSSTWFACWTMAWRESRRQRLTGC